MRFAHLLLYVAIFFANVLTCRTAASAQELAADPADPELDKLHQRSVQFLEGVSSGRADLAFGELLRNSPLETQQEAIEKLIEESRTLEKKYGAYQSFEPVAAKRVGEHLVLMKYLYKCENFPVVWYFTYYHDFKRSTSAADGNAWMLIAVRFDTRLELLAFEPNGKP